MHDSNILIRRILESEWQIYKELRLVALKLAPEAFGAKYEDAIKRLDSDWILQTQNFSKGTDSINFLAFVNGQPLGMVSCYIKERAEMIQMWVDPSIRGLGIGKELVTQLKQWVKETGASYLFATVYKTNTAAFRLYNHLGFIQVGDTSIEIHLSCRL